VLAAVAFRMGATPNVVSLVSAAFTFAGIGMLALAEPVPWLGIVIWFLLAVGYALDSADGQVARLRGGGSLAGEWLDHFIDAVKTIVLHLAVVVGMYRFYHVDELFLLVPLAFTLVAGVSFFGMILNDLLKGKVGVPSAAAAGGASPWRSLLLVPVDYGFLCLVFALWGLPMVFQVAYSLVFVAHALFLVLATVKWFRAMKALDRQLGR
jgi:phosphatidylglycerophosphate synthase